MERSSAARNVLVAVFLLCASANASVIMSHSSNGAVLYDWVEVGFLGPNSVASDFATDSSKLHVLPSPGPFTRMSRAEQSRIPWSSINIYDIAHGIARTYYTFDAAPDAMLSDKITLSISGTGGAHDAHNRAGDPSSAELRAVSSFRFNVDVPASISGNPVGYLYVDPLPPADMYSTYIQVAVFENGVPVKWRRPGGAAMNVPLLYNNSYELRLLYEGSVAFQDCHGLHPDYVPQADPHRMAYNVNATIIHAPEPGGILALAGGALFLSLRPGKRRA
jgi:hypothetical protein